MGCVWKQVLQKKAPSYHDLVVLLHIKNSTVGMDIVPEQTPLSTLFASLAM